MFCFQCGPTFYRAFQAEGYCDKHLYNHCSYSKSFMKPQSSAIASSHLCNSGERNKEQKKALVEP